MEDLPGAQQGQATTRKHLIVSSCLASECSWAKPCQEKIGDCKGALGKGTFVYARPVPPHGFMKPAVAVSWEGDPHDQMKT